MRRESRVAAAGLRRRYTYPVAALLLLALLTTGQLALRSFLSGGAPSWSFVADDLRANLASYIYVALVGGVALAALGFALGKREDTLETTMLTDPLTEVANRRLLDVALGSELARALRYRTPLALLFLDVDHLKALNDQGGHGAGDRALKLVGQSLRASCRAIDLPARFGGDEFVVLAPSTTATDALALAQRIRAALRSLAADSPALPVTVSIGIADLARADARTAEALCRTADRALYAAKTAGRDRVVLAPSPTRESPRARRLHRRRRENGNEQARAPFHAG
jgi:diguanylate cyclase (GGDEF)-like protein